MWTGIDISNSAIKVVQVNRRLNGSYEVTGAARVKFQMPEDESRFSQVIGMALAQIFNETGLMPDNCVLGVTGKEINLRVTHIPPTPSRARLQKMMEYEVMQIAGKSSENVYSDYAEMTLLGKTYPEVPVMVGLAKNTYIDDRIRPLRERGANLRNICPRAIGLSNALRASQMLKPAEIALLVDVDKENSEIIIQQGEHLIFARNLGGGTEQIEPLISSAVSFAKTQLKLDSLVIDRFLLSGDVDKNAFDSLLASLNMKFEVFEPSNEMAMSGLKVEARDRLAKTPNDMAIALGLAMSGYLPHKGQISFLPPDIKKKINLYQIRLPLIGAAVIFAAAMIMLALNNWQESGQERSKLNKLESQKKFYVQQAEQFKKLETKKNNLRVQYEKLNQLQERGAFFYETINMLRQLPDTAWIKDLSFTVVPPSPKDKNPSESKVTVIRGYLEDDSPSSLENLKNFVAGLNQGATGSKASLEKLNKPDVVMPQGKMEFEITIK
ncbi:MAG: pilus assembly protein PilM [Candidatus Brocadiia bacterium]